MQQLLTNLCWFSLLENALDGISYQDDGTFDTCSSAFCHGFAMP